jgi:hypothetical protein
MLKTFRTFLIGLLVLAIPAQGFAAATMLYCGTDHQPAGAVVMQHASHSMATLAAAAVHDASPGTHTHQGHDLLSGHADHALQDADAADGTAQASAAGTPDLSQNVKCSVCATCCSLAAMMSSSLLISTATASLAPVLRVPAQVFNFITDGPKRPPRSFLA